MRVVTLLGSAKKKEKYRYCSGMDRKGTRTIGIRLKQIYLNNKSIKGCLGCCKCQENPDEIACVQIDDAAHIMAQMISSGVVLFASPIYFWSFSVQIKALIDQGYSQVTNYHKPGHTSLLGLSNSVYVEWIYKN